MDTNTTQFYLVDDELKIEQRSLAHLWYNYPTWFTYDISTLVNQTNGCEFYGQVRTLSNECSFECSGYIFNGSCIDSCPSRYQANYAKKCICKLLEDDACVEKCSSWHKEQSG